MNYLKTSKDNKEARLHFVRYWAEYVRTHDDKVWGRQQAMLINSQMQRARQNKMTARQYLELKGEWCER